LAQATQSASGDVLFEQRGVALLERIGSAEARQVLRELAKGMPSAPLTRQAKAALGRMRYTTAPGSECRYPRDAVTVGKAGLVLLPHRDLLRPRPQPRRLLPVGVLRVCLGGGLRSW